jgi:PAS domain S-box-containing protein
MQEIVQKGRIVFETLHKAKDGLRYVVEVSTTYDADNEVYYSVGRDLTEKKQQLVLLKESEAKFKALFFNNHVVMLIIDPETAKIVEANPAAAEFYGHSIEHLKEMLITEINVLSPQELTSEIQLASTLGKNKFNFKHRLATGEIKDVEVFSGPITIQNKKYLYSIVQDITERKETERLLARSEAMHKAIFDARFSGIMIHDQGIVLECNKGLSDLTGYTRDELIGMNGYLLMSPEFRPVAQEAVRQGLESPYIL